MNEKNIDKRKSFLISSASNIVATFLYLAYFVIFLILTLQAKSYADSNYIVLPTGFIVCIIMLLIFLLINAVCSGVSAGLNLKAERTNKGIVNAICMNIVNITFVFAMLIMAIVTLCIYLFVIEIIVLTIFLVMFSLLISFLIIYEICKNESIKNEITEEESDEIQQLDKDKSIFEKKMNNIQILKDANLIDEEQYNKLKQKIVLEYIKL